ncbi:MAG: phosphatase PAP2 family protein [Deltaproteobacteria bacterium]|nr:phosphatase PAP2 family protein [Deltaproteobacteria bacterium]
MRRFLILTIVSLGALTVAQADPSTDTQSPTPAQQAAGSGSGEIAPPAPDAKPQDVQKAKEIAKTADLTPIVPNPGNPSKPAYQLYAELDPPILATGLVFIYGRSYKVTPVYCAPLCDPNGVKSGPGVTNPYPGLNALDKVTAGYYSAGWSTASDIGLYGLAGAAAVTLVADEGVLSGLNDGVVVAEATLSAAALGSIMTLAAGRPRPLMYGDKAPESLRESGNGGLSFISSHTSESFALATSLFVTEHRRHPDEKWPYYMLGGGLGVASFVATARVMSGYHFITDVIGGAVVGSSVGVLITSVHKSPVKVIPVTNQDARGNLSGGGVGISGEF